MAKEKKTRRSYKGVVVFSKLASPILKALYYIFVVSVLLCGIVALIILLVNTSVEDMLLPPLMSVHENEYYSIYLGSGIRIDAAYDTVTLGDIKTVIYAQLFMCAAVLCMLAPIMLFLSQLLKNVATDALYNLQNARKMIYIGFSIMVGYTLVQAAGRFYNYLLVKTFVTDGEAIRLSMGLDLDGVLIGTLIILFAGIFGHVCELHITENMKLEEHTELTEL